MIEQVKIVSDSVHIANSVPATLPINPEKIHTALFYTFMLATDIADYLVPQAAVSPRAKGTRSY
jgi:argininosuccinate lyase